ncbi:MAG TPA: hypothetical protein VGG64_16115 [Pirellulales bacterium]|jgi:hypothetical protein
MTPGKSRWQIRLGTALVVMTTLACSFASWRAATQTDEAILAEVAYCLIGFSCGFAIGEISSRTYRGACVGGLLGIVILFAVPCFWPLFRPFIN